ncbi:MAG: hypothetical protein A3B74_02405 [Candidatus Kerfeldbacteria bacterium RIFCSPHIGHO2_02_FULL_42_14]|uniref:Uncharacterized protein n=1 Tax=Candidatus Kerfeldbacteria bacterium RIFCSPHIGHO2_02_FULL_42_14 TaxID=1798540 RepID=A0A1G2ARR4_9BACT|nr:MAG: hypothetical protein A3B74_02405 [Candidatus Kerfeldbacteria bacterium RIFCSPHIGHO2_02_FULL_42_14]OGY80396.1 MAG: hypothetical protein A3E60_05025 [Candidatus Kerfeldbacteria bacterium RIFCSPHIGHO2_12_FULL_42_13]OGY83825.1 MAG: hypothetical protein A3I91_04550 [Candidatus Kerfeldbacteria bacterium RIFCSPLOWO2_02_FULL_42_19]OGY85401.1 MAG: hypothetical protein A3G01_02315 [Candidatus Kerfeldbacteria bacterium RIFCSPLOWO2_12_FULL_43_9]
MHNWNIDLKELKKNKKQYTIWKLEQMVNFGLTGEKINKKELKKYWYKLDLDPAKKKFLSLLLWKKPS